MGEGNILFKNGWKILLDKDFKEKIDGSVLDYHKVIIKYLPLFNDEEIARKIYIEDKYLPLYPEENSNVTKTIIIENLNGINFTYNEEQTRNSWHGTGTDYEISIIFDAKHGTYEEIPMLFDAPTLIENIDDIQSYEDFISFIESIKEYLKNLMFSEK